jgi:GT2 family glycosyltransferase/glycosyltransferase involved in cell wall biosynthesis
MRGNDPTMPNQRNRVAVLTNRLLDWSTREPQFGGGEQYCLTLGRFLEREGFEVTFFQAGHEAFEGRYFGFPVRALPIGGFFSEFHYGVCDRFAEAAADFERVIIMVPAYGSGRVRKDAVLICHGIWFDHDNWGPPIQFRTPEWFAHLYRAFSQPARVVSVDTSSIGVIRALWPELAAHMRYLPNWVDRNVFQPASRAGERLTVLFPRRAEVNRGARLVEPILAAVPHDVQFVWVGDGDPDDTARLRDLQSRDARFTWRTATFDEMPALYAAADLAVIPTVAAEGTSLSCLEALASGCAVVSTNVGGLVDLIQDGANGLLVEPDAAAVASAINRLVTDPHLRGELQRAGAESASRFGLDVWESRWRALLTELGWFSTEAGAPAEFPAQTAGPVHGVRLASAGVSDSAPRIAYLEGQLSEWNRIFEAQRDSLTFLQQELLQRNKQVDFLTGEVQAFDRVDGFQKEELLTRSRMIAEQRETIEFLKSEVAARDRIVALQKDELLGRERTIAGQREAIELLQGEVDSGTAETAELRKERETRDAEWRAAKRLAEAVQAELEIRDSQVRRLEAHSAQQAEGIDWLRTEMALREEKLQGIYGSKLWKTAGLYWRGVGFAGRLVSGPKAIARRILPGSAKQDAAAHATQAALPVPAAPAEAGAPPPMPSKFDVICFSIIDWSFRWQRPQQIMARLAREGHRVFFLSTTEFLPWRGESSGESYRLTPLRENVWELKIATPGALDVYGGLMSPELARCIADDFDRLRRDLNITCAVSFVQVPTWSAAAYETRERFGWRVVYDCMDEWNTFPGMKQPLLEAEKELVRKTDVLVVSAQRLVEKWQDDRPDLLLARNAADFDHYANVQANDLLAVLPHPIVGYFGAIADWFDLPLMVRLAKERPQYSFVLIGGIFNVPMEELEALPNVAILGQQPYERMPQYLLHFDACIIPFVVNAVTEATDPVKFYEYIAMGKPVVAPRMPELYHYREHLYIADDHEDFLRKVDEAVAERDPALRERRVELARRNTWTARVADIKTAVHQAHDKVSIVVVTYHNLEYSKLCIESVFRNTIHPSFELIVVDNASNDGTPEYLKALAAEHDNVKIILNSHNLGFARANNQGLEVATGEHFVLLNNDTIVPNGWLPRLLRHLVKPELGLIVTVTNFSGNESRITVPYDIAADGMVADGMLAMEEFAARYTTAHEGELFDIRVAAMYCVALRRDVYAQVGPLDEQFSIGMFEDDDYSERVRRAGYRVVCVEDVFVHHFGQASFRKLPQSEYQALWERNQQLYEKKWGVPWKPHTLRAGVR